MADSDKPFGNIQQAQAQKEVTANGDLDAVWPAALGGRMPETCAALTWGYHGGNLDVSGTPTRVPDGTLALTANSTCYIRVSNEGSPAAVVDFVTSPPSGWPGPMTGYVAWYEVITASSTISSWVDRRESGGGATGSGGGSVPTGTGFRHVTSGAEDGTAVAVDLSSAHATGTLAAGRFPALTGDCTTSAGSLATTVKATECLIVACTDETTSITADVNKVKWRMPYAFTLTDVRASLTTAQASGSIFTVNIKESGTTIFSTTLTIDNTETTSTTAATARVISDSSLADDAEMNVDVDQIGDGTATGLKIYLIGKRT